MFGLLYLVFGALFLVGLITMGASGYWYLAFSRASTEFKRYDTGYPINACLACGNGLVIAQDTQTKLSIPAISRRILACSTCSSQLTSSTPGRWLVQLDQNREPELAWLYNGNTLTDAQLRNLATGQHTQLAQEKLANRAEHQRQAARKAALKAIADGDIESLNKLPPNLIEQPGPTALLRASAAIPQRFTLHRSEQCLLVIPSVTLGEQRTKEGRHYIKQIEAGEFVVTDSRYGFEGGSKSVNQKLSVIEGVESQDKTLTIRRSNRKTPEYFIGIDAELVEAILKGLARQI